MRAVLDSNIFIFALRSDKEVFAEILKFAGMRFNCFIPRMVFYEVFERLKSLEGKDFAAFAAHTIKSLNLEIIADELIPHELIEKYHKRGAKEGDGVIAAFAEWIKADCLVTENRDFLKEMRTDFTTLNAEEFIRLILK